MKLNIGSGFRYREGFVNLDINEVCKIDVKANATRLPFKDCLFDEVYSKAVLEHFSWRNIFDILWEWRRVVKFGGILKVIVPDWGWIRKQDKTAFEISAWLLGAQRNTYDYHKAIFDSNTLEMLFRQVGLKIKSTKNENYYLTVVGVK